MKSLLAIWNDSKILDGAVRNKAGYEKIAQSKDTNKTGNNAIPKYKTSIGR